jgi:hypothetical protein
LTGTDGKPILADRYASYMPRETSERALAAFAEAAVLSIMPKLREALLLPPNTTAAPR